MGVSLYVMLNDALPFADNLKEQLRQQLTRNWELTCSSQTLQDLINKMLEPNPVLRIQVSEVFYNPWVADGARKPKKGRAKSKNSTIQ